jgi:outer membrane protein assembly factor BamE
VFAPRAFLSMAGMLVLAMALGACSVRMPTAYSPPLQQGNVIEQASLSKLKPGMTRAQVRFVLGTPLVVDVFRNDRWDYVYLLRRQGEAPQQRRVTVIFDGDLLARIEGDVVPGSGTAPERPAVKAGAAKAAPGAGKGEPAKVEPAKVEPAKVEPAKGEPAKGEGAATGAVKPDPVKADGAEPQRGFFGRMLDRIGF